VDKRRHGLVKLELISFRHLPWVIEMRYSCGDFAMDNFINSSNQTGIQFGPSAAFFGTQGGAVEKKGLPV